MKIRKRKKGSYTIEASLLMGVILPVLVGIIYMGFFLHDKSFTQAAAYEAAVYASLHADDKKTDVNDMANRLIKGRLLGTGGVICQSSAGEREVKVSCRGNFTVPGMIRQLLGQQQISSEVVLSVERPSKRIQRIRGVIKIAKKIRGSES